LTTQLLCCTNCDAALEKLIQAHLISQHVALSLRTRNATAMVAALPTRSGRSMARPQRKH
jgi:hypothetical protein